MFRADTGNFNRFLTSLGLVLLVAALLIPYFFFRDMEILRLPRQELQGMTAIGRETLEARQRHIADLEGSVVVVALLIASGGVGALVLGGRRLRVAQAKEDEAIERQAERENYEIRELSSVEVERRQGEQVREAVDEESFAASSARSDGEAEEGAGDLASSLQVDEAGMASPPVRLRTVAETKRDIARVEARMHAVFEAEQFARFTYRPQVKVAPAGPRQPDLSPRQVSIDGLFESTDQFRADVALELKVTRLSVRSLKSRTRMFTDPLLASLSRYRQLTGREVLGWLLVLVPEDAEQIDQLERHYVEKHFEQGLAGLGRCAMLQEQDLDQLPQRFSEVFG